VLQAALDLIGPQAAALGVTVGAEPDGGLHPDVVVIADPQRLLQVLLNLLSNGVKYNRPGGRVMVSGERSGGTVSISVTDTGHGIADTDMEHLFVPFERLGAERSDVEGSGVGLTLSRLLTQQMGGSLTVFSQVGIGSTFTVELPEGMSGEPISAPPSSETIDRITRVLCIEDDVENSRVVQRAAEHVGGIEVLTALQGRLGIDLASQLRPDLILLELHLPDVPGAEVLRRLRLNEKTASIPVVVCTTDGRSDDRGRTDAHGLEVVAVLTKPFDLAVLVDVLEHVRDNRILDPLRPF
jgi:CheY-like chemotaxis protein